MIVKNVCVERHSAEAEEILGLVKFDLRVLGFDYELVLRMQCILPYQKLSVDIRAIHR